MRGYYSVFNPRGEKIADCGIERDAVVLMNTRNRRWDGHYFTFIPLPGDIVNISTQKYIGGDFIEIEGQEVPTQQYLNITQEEPLDL